MANILPFRALRYDPARVDLSQVVTQPYDKISQQMQAHYYDASPYNLVRIILGKREPEDAQGNDVYSRAAGFFEQWRQNGILRQDVEPSIYSYRQRFSVPGTGREAERRGFIALGRIEDYSEGVVFRHEQTLSKPKTDRLNLLRATKAHFGQIFMLYEGGDDIDRHLEVPPDAEVRDEYGVVHILSRISDPKSVSFFQQQLRQKRLIIADGHHRYETALNYRNERRMARRAAAGGGSGGSAPAGEGVYEYVMMTFINMNSPGVLILPTHRVVHSLASFSMGGFATAAQKYFDVTEIAGDDVGGMMLALREAGRSGTALLAVGREKVVLLTQPKAMGEEIFRGLSKRQQSLDVVQLHRGLLEGVLGLSEESIANQQNFSYLRDAEEAVSKVRRGEADVAFLMNAARIDQVRDIAFAGEVLPQKSTDFYPKLLSGLTIYALE
jgi:uncharacterized protein (DUF1015 family)